MSFSNRLKWRKNFSELYISHFQVDWMLLLRLFFCNFSHRPKPRPGYPYQGNQSEPSGNYWTNQSLSMIAAGLSLVTLLGVSAAGFCTMWEITKQYLNKIIQSTRKWLCCANIFRTKSGHPRTYHDNSYPVSSNMCQVSAKILHNYGSMPSKYSCGARSISGSEPLDKFCQRIFLSLTISYLLGT